MMNPFDIQEWKPTFCKTEEELKVFWEEHQIASVLLDHKADQNAEMKNARMKTTHPCVK